MLRIYEAHRILIVIYRVAKKGRYSLPALKGTKGAERRRSDALHSICQRLAMPGMAEGRPSAFIPANTLDGNIRNARTSKRL